MERLAFLGAGDLAVSLRAYLEDRGEDSIVGVLDDARRRGELVHGLEVLGGSADAPELHRKRAFDRIIFAVGYRRFDARSSLFRKLQEEGVPVKGVIHPTAYVHPSAKLGAGVHLFPGTIVDFGVVLEENVVANTGCILAHHARIGAHTYFGPGVKVSGFTSIGSRCFVGIGSTLIEKIHVGDGCTIAAGAVVLEDVPADSLVAGVPATLKKHLR
jgi:sugar O-acyltransferase (sialic acid O-acetyltransferase NeuD family)